MKYDFNFIIAQLNFNLVQANYQAVNQRDAVEGVLRKLATFH